jgi:protein translocase SEC61 complex gamma subunit
VLNLLSNLILKIKEMVASYRRVLVIARKPDKDEFVKTAKICLIGMGLVGLIGFIVYSFSILFLA